MNKSIRLSIAFFPALLLISASVYTCYLNGFLSNPLGTGLTIAAVSFVLLYLRFHYKSKEIKDFYSYLIPIAMISAFLLSCIFYWTVLSKEPAHKIMVADTQRLKNTLTAEYMDNEIALTYKAYAAIRDLNAHNKNYEHEENTLNKRMNHWQKTRIILANNDNYAKVQKLLNARLVILNENRDGYFASDLVGITKTIDDEFSQIVDKNELFPNPFNLKPLITVAFTSMVKEFGKSLLTIFLLVFGLFYSPTILLLLLAKKKD